MNMQGYFKQEQKMNFEPTLSWLICKTSCWSQKGCPNDLMYGDFGSKIVSYLFGVIPHAVIKKTMTLRLTQMTSLK